MNDIPFVAIGNNELKHTMPLKNGDLVKCRKCEKWHKVRLGVDSGTDRKSNLIMFYLCGEGRYLAGIKGKAIP